MKTLVALISLVSSISLASIQPIGTFIPSTCSSSNDEIQVCFGTKAGFGDRQYVSISLNRYEATIYQVTHVEPMNAGINPDFSAATLTLTSETGEEITVIENGYLGVTEAVTLTNADGTKTVVSGFRQMMTIQ